MQTIEKKPLILTIRFDPDSEAFFNAQREFYFPPERNFLQAHLTVFHQLPDQPATYGFLAGLDMSSFNIQVTGLMNLGAGVAYRLESQELAALHRQLSAHFLQFLIPQDRHGFRPHVVIMNKSTPENARALMSGLSVDFKPFKVQATGLDLWAYLGGPWSHQESFLFNCSQG